MPNFWLGLLLIIYVGGYTEWFPTGGRAPLSVPMDGPTGLLLVDSVVAGRFSDIPVILEHLALPAITLGTSMAGIVMRMTRSSMVEVIGDDFVRTARAKGVPSRKITRRHVLRNALLPVTTVVGLEMASLLSGSIIIEAVFAWPGLGELLITSVSVRDYALVQGIVVVFAVLFVFLNLLVDLSYAVIDPRIRYD
jgi:ABC-type dipeptide/oligopeptide/nickel transport system permease component